MGDENANKNQDTNQEKGRAMSAGVSGNYQGDQKQPGQQHDARGSRPNEVAGQGGGTQGTGQSQSNPGGYTQGENRQRDDARENEGFNKEEKRP